MIGALQRAARAVASRLGHTSAVVRTLRPAYEAALASLTGDRGIPWTINGVPFRIDPHYRHQLSEVYDVPVTAFLRERVRPGSLCMDVGANVGVWVLQFAHWSAPDGRVVAFEPNEGARRVLERHIRMNGFQSRARVVPAAVGATPGKATLFAAEADGMSRLGAPNRRLAGRTEERTVEVVTLDDFCAREGLKPDWLFLDIEGFEIAALKGARRLIRERGRAMGVVVEMHPDVWDSADTSREDAERLLDELGLRAVPLGGQSDPLGAHGHILLEHR